MIQKLEIKTNTLGTFTFLFSVVFYDYPRCFVCKNNDGWLFLLNETKEDEDTIEWAGVRISIDRLIALNCNKISLQACFRLPEFFKRYLFKKSGMDTSVVVSELGEFPSYCITQHDDFLGGFLPDSHGVLLSSIANDEDTLSIVSETTKEHPDSILFTRVSKLLRAAIDFFNSIGCSDLVKQSRFALRPTGSLVASFSIPKSTLSPSNSISVVRQTITEATDFATSLEKGGSILNNNVKTIGKCKSFLNSVSSFSPKGGVLVFSNTNLKEINVFDTSKLDSRQIKKRFVDMSNIVSQKSHQQQIECDGYLSGIFADGSKRFSFHTYVNGKKGKESIVYSGVSLINSSNLKLTFEVNGFYHASIIQKYYGDKDSPRNCSYELLSLKKKDSIPLFMQESLFDNN